jgi:hypothetical protein
MSPPLLLILLFIPSARAQNFTDIQAPHFTPAVSAPSANDCGGDFDPKTLPLDDGKALAGGSFESKVEGRDFPSVFQAWEPASNLSRAESLAKHDLVWTGVGAYGLKGNSRWAGLATSYTGNVAGGGPNTVRLAEIRWYDGHFEDGDDPNKQYLPKGHPWWLSKGGAMVGANTTLTSPYFRLDHHNPCFQAQVARQCKAAIAAGLDGCMFDWWPNADADQVQMLKGVREAIGNSGLIIVNANGADPESSMPYINGVFTEGFAASFWPSGQGYAKVPYPKAEAWQYLISDLQALESQTQSPHINAIEGWGGAGDERYLRALTAVVLVYSKAYVLFSRPNKTVPNHDHTHAWDPFWDKGLGTPTSEATPVPGGAVKREFTGGTVVYNPSQSAVSISFPEPRTSRATGKAAPLQQVLAGDGDIFLK